MATPALLLLGALTVMVVVLAVPDQKYTTKFDNVDLDDVLNNARLFKSAFECLMEKGNCSPDVLELRKALPDALQTKCSKCSEKQKEGARKVLKFLIDKKADHFDELEKKYDPEGVYRKQYKEEAAKEGYNI